jgi:DNA-binding transcriptional LysR family regulator
MNRLQSWLPPKLLEKHPIRIAADLLASQLILSEATLIKWPQLFAQHGVSRPEKPYTLSFDRSYMTLEAASHGLGFALESTLLAQDYLARCVGRGSAGAERFDYCTPLGFPKGPRTLPSGQTIPGMDAERVGA